MKNKLVKMDWFSVKVATEFFEKPVEKKRYLARKKKYIAPHCNIASTGSCSRQNLVQLGKGRQSRPNRWELKTASIQNDKVKSPVPLAAARAR